MKSIWGGFPIWGSHKMKNKWIWNGMGNPGKWENRFSDTWKLIDLDIPENGKSHFKMGNPILKWDFPF